MIDCKGDRCTLQGPVTADNVVALLAQGAQRFTAPSVTVDLSGVTEVDSSALSLLLEWRREAVRNRPGPVALDRPAHKKADCRFEIADCRLKTKSAICNLKSAICLSGQLPSRKGNSHRLAIVK